MNHSLRRLMIATPLLFVSLITHSQENLESIWVTFASHDDVPELQEGALYSKNTSLQTLIETFSITSVEQAVPASQREALQRIYEVSCYCDASELSNEINQREVPLLNPEPAPKYELLNEPNDYLLNFSSDYALDLIHASEAWSYSTGDPSLVIGISDGNYYDAHEDLEGKIAYLEPGNYTNNYYHGTAVAITAAGQTNNNMGKSSIGYDCNLHLTVTSYNKILEMSQAGIRVINMSWTTACFDSPYIQGIIDEAYDKGAILVAAAGNGSTCGGSTNLVFPAACNHVISVTSIGSQDNHEKIMGDPNSTHQHNSRVDICAPGYGVPVSIAPGYYNYSNGSSFAAPFVSGTIGLMLSLRPCLTFEEVEEILKQTADDVYAVNPSYTNQLGAGRLNAGKALELTKTYCRELTVSNTSGTVSVSNSDNTSTNVTDSLYLSSDQSFDVSLNSTNQSVSIDEDEIMEVTLYPNPTANQSTLRWENKEAVEVFCHDSKGTLLEHQLITPDDSEATIHLAVSGVYIVTMVKDQKTVWRGRLVRF